jgi:hypothetical protein
MPIAHCPAWRAGTTTLLDAPALQATGAGGIVFLELIPGLLKCLHIRALLFKEWGGLDVKSTEYTECQAFSPFVRIWVPHCTPSPTIVVSVALPL